MNNWVLSVIVDLITTDGWFLMLIATAFVAFNRPQSMDEKGFHV